MTNEFLIDGYNLLHAMGLLSGSPLESMEPARRQLLDYLAEHMGDRCRWATIVFDSNRLRRRGPDETDFRGLRVCFTQKGQEADDWIEAELKRRPLPRRLVVVSNDHRLIDAARRRQAEALTCMEFLDRIEMDGKATATDSPTADTSLSDEKETRHWLKEFSDLDKLGEWKELFEPFNFEEDNAP